MPQNIDLAFDVETDQRWAWWGADGWHAQSACDGRGGARGKRLGKSGCNGDVPRHSARPSSTQGRATQKMGLSPDRPTARQHTVAQRIAILFSRAPTVATDCRHWRPVTVVPLSRIQRHSTHGEERKRTLIFTDLS